jgi:hypothetical protein
VHLTGNATRSKRDEVESPKVNFGNNPKRARKWPSQKLLETKRSGKPRRGQKYIKIGLKGNKTGVRIGSIWLRQDPATGLINT